MINIYTYIVFEVACGPRPCTLAQLFGIGFLWHGNRDSYISVLPWALVM